MSKVILGINTQFLYPESIVDPVAHTESLKKLSQATNVDALDCWMWRGERAKEERDILLASGKVINYNIGDRFGEEIAQPSSKSQADRDRAYDLMMREIEHGLSVNTKKIIFGSGPDHPEDHQGAIERFEELIMKVSTQLPSDVQLALEPTDWDIDKFFLFGRMEETVDFIHRLQKNGVNIGMLLDMCHVPIMHETLESALEKAQDTLIHIHLGNAVIKNPANPFYGDKHIPWDYADSEYTCADGVRFINMLKDKGYFDHDNATVTFEMRPFEGTTPEESLQKFVDVYNSAWK